MAGTGLAPPNIRIIEEEPESALPGDHDVIVEQAEEPDESKTLDEYGNVLKIEYADGSIAVSLDGQPIEKAEKEKKELGWYDNLADDGRIDEGELTRISEELLRGIDSDIQSRTDWIESRAQGIKLLGLKIELPGVGSTADGAPVDGQSRVRHPLLLEAVLRFQANARSELLPTDGPVKIRDDSTGSTAQTDRQADALEKDLNHYLTTRASEYYPDTDRMLLMTGFGGSGFKKVYFCPLRNRPVSESVDADDLIVNQAATDLSNAKRVTHRSFMRPSTVKRMQILGVYRDVDLSTPLAPKQDAMRTVEKEQQGITDDPKFPDDRDREIYECYCELDIKGFEHKHKGIMTGLELPYCVTIDISSRKILSITRNYREPAEGDLPVARERFVKYTFVPGIGFYDIGLVHILGNTTNAITAAWRELLDAGMYSNFPGFLMADTGARQNTNIFRVPPGGAALVKTGGVPIKDALMALPYKEPSMALMQLVQNMAETGQRIGGTAEMQVGEGRAEAPVGTTLALIEQAVKVMSAVHKRLCTAQAKEFELLVDCFRDHPDSFWSRGCKSKTKWDEQSFLQALDNCELVPQADPNTSSRGERVMKIMALKELQKQNPSMYDPIAIDRAALQAMGWSNPDQFLAPPSAQAAPPPELIEKQKKTENDTKRADAMMITAQSGAIKAKAEVATMGLGGGEKAQPAMTPAEEHAMRTEAEAKAMDARTRAEDAQTRRETLAFNHQKTAVEDRNRDEDRASREKVQIMELARDIVLHPENEADIGKEMKEVRKDVGIKE